MDSDKNKLTFKDNIVSLLTAIAIGFGVCLVAGVITALYVAVMHTPTGFTGLYIFVFLTGVFSFALFFKRDKHSAILDRSLKVVLIFWLICSIWAGYVVFTVIYNETTSNTTAAKKISSDQYLKQIGNYSKEYCTRTEFYPIDLNFVASIYYIQQNASKIQYFSGYLSDLNLIKNCLDISYANSEAEMSGANGLFFFSSPESGKNHFKILISPSYKKSDMILNSYLLAHEITHAEQFIHTDIYNRVNSECTTMTDEATCKWLIPKTHELLGIKDCIGNEAEAWQNQGFFLVTTPGDSLGKLVVYSNYYKYDPQVAQAENLFYFTGKVVNACIGNDKEACTRQNFRNFVSSIPAYQKQCGLTK